MEKRKRKFYEGNKNRMNYKIIERAQIKRLVSEEYNYIFDSITGLFCRWGRTESHDPDYSPFGPEIMDIEISTICHGLDGYGPCPWCYKSNTGVGDYMTFDTFVKMFEKFPKTLTQIAFGIGDIDGNPDMYRIFDYCKDHGIVPNVTVNGARLTEYHITRLANTCGAVAVSCYEDTDVCLNAVDRLTNAGLKQVNIHSLLSEETYDRCMKLIDSATTDARLEKMKAIVFLWLKPKGKRNTFHQLTDKMKYKALVKYAFDKGVGIGFDSCSAPMFMEAIQDHEKKEELSRMVESCESTLFSYYINCNAVGFPCSFTEDEEAYKGVNILEAEDFMKDVWNHPETVKFRETNMASMCDGCRKCVQFNLGSGM